MIFLVCDAVPLRCVAQSQVKGEVLHFQSDPAGKISTIWSLLKLITASFSACKHTVVITILEWMKNQLFSLEVDCHNLVSRRNFISYNWYCRVIQGKPMRWTSSLGCFKKKLSTTKYSWIWDSRECYECSRRLWASWKISFPSILNPETPFYSPAAKRFWLDMHAHIGNSITVGGMTRTGCARREQCQCQPWSGKTVTECSLQSSKVSICDIDMRRSKVLGRVQEPSPSSQLSKVHRLFLYKNKFFWEYL